MKYIIGAYSQIPYGADDASYENLLENQLRPLLTMLYQNVNYKFLLRLGVNVFDWLENNHPEINMLIFDLCKKEQVELLSSPDFDAILPLIPNHERSQYIERTTSYIRKKFSRKPKGFFNSFQIFSPSVISSVNLSSIDYMVTSTYEQCIGKELINKPFYMEEMGKGIYVFPMDDRLSKEVSELNKSKDNPEKFYSNMVKLLNESSNSPNTIMINLDQLSFSNDYVKLFSRLFESVGNNCTLPSLYLKEKEITNSFYLPSGVYGRDFPLGKRYSINQIILDNKKYYKNFALNGYFREITHDFKKNSDLKKNIDALLMKASAGSVYIKSPYTNSTVENFANRYLCEIESKLYTDNYEDLPLIANITGEKIAQDIFPHKNQIVYVNRKGAVIERFVSYDTMSDIAFYDGIGCFADNFKSTVNFKLPSISGKIFELNSVDKKRQDVVYYLGNVELQKCFLDIYKRFRFAKNMISLDIDLENKGDSQVKDIVYENLIKLALSEKASVKKNKVEEVSFVNPLSSSEISVKFNCPVELQVQPIFGSDNVYKYHQIRVSHPLGIDAKSIDHLYIELEIEKIKEKNI